MAKLNSALILGMVAASIGFVLAVTEEERNAVKLAGLPLVRSCSSELGISMEAIKAAKESKDVDALNPCFYACFFKKVGTMTSDGFYDPAAAKNTHKQYIHGADDLQKLDLITDICASVNEQAVTDGANGCDRAKLLVHCLKDNKDTFDLFP